MAEVETHLTRDLSREDALAIGQLLVGIWPKPGVTVEDRADRLQTDRGATAENPQWESRSILVRGDNRVIAHALIFPRTVRTEQGAMTLAALASVCSHPEYRGKNLGATVVRAAFEVVDDDSAPFSLFQTSPTAKPFYERLSATVVENGIVNSLADNPRANPFWDEVIMRYPADRSGWPEGEIDLLGAGY